MNALEKELLAAIRNGRPFNSANTRYDADSGRVYLHGNHIATVDGAGTVTPNRHTFGRWPTATTRSRLVALGVDARIRNFTPYIDGEVCL